MNTITVITPCYNVEKYISDCILSVQKSVTLNLFHIQHLIVNDACTDESLKRMESVIDSTTAILHHPANQGPSAARNTGLLEATGKYVFFLDADDVIFKNSLRYLYQKAEQDQADWVYGDFLRGNYQLQYEIDQDYYGWNFKSPADLLTSLFTGNHFFQQNSFFAKQVFERVGGFRPELSMAEDFDLCTRLLLDNIFPKYLPGPLYMHRTHETNLSKIHSIEPQRHKADIKQLFGTYQSQLKEQLTPQQFTAIENYLRGKKA